MELVFATHNRNKLAEVQQLMPSEIRLLSLDDIGCQEDIAETEETIEGNALLKARYVFERFGRSCFADDSGLEVSALNGAPGVYSARFAGPEKNDAANNLKLLESLEGKPDRAAQFKTVIALVTDDAEYIFEGICRGEILHSPIGEKGFGYDPLFLPNGFEKTFAQMSMEEKGRISHRGRAIAKLVAHLAG